MRPSAVPKRIGTRERILGVCRDLFNASGPGAVTTAEIAAAAGISEGNLHYHFQRKEQIVEALFAEFAAATRAVAASHATGRDDPERYGGYLGAWFNLMWEWRVFYRDGAAIFALAPSLRPHLKALSDESQAQVRAALADMVAEKLLAASPEEIETLIVNTWIVSTYWIDYLRTIRGVTQIEREHLGWGARQLQSLFAPYLTERGRALVMLGV